MTTAEHAATLCEAFQRTAAIDPDAVALRTPHDTETLTWREYAAQVCQAAAGLAGLGVRRGDTVSLGLLRSTPETSRRLSSQIRKSPDSSGGFRIV
jgi:long-subunit acyl-CoA synthetase (AMP-forming)